MSWQPIWLSLQVAAASLFLVVIFGLAWAWALRRWDIPGKDGVLPPAAIQESKRIDLLPDYYNGQIITRKHQHKGIKQ